MNDKFLRLYKLFSNILFLAFLVLFLIIGLSVVPIPGNYKIYTVLSGSMNPTIKVGSIVFVKPLKDYVVKDIVTFRTDKPKETVTHRVVAENTIGQQKLFITRGDVNKNNDSEKLLPQNIIGKVFFSIPFFGYLISYSRTLPGLIIMIVIPATIIVYSELINIKNEAVKLINNLSGSKNRKKKQYEK